MRPTTRDRELARVLIEPSGVSVGKAIVSLEVPFVPHTDPTCSHLVAHAGQLRYMLRVTALWLIWHDLRPGNHQGYMRDVEWDVKDGTENRHSP